jgi:hypothetical protein
LHHRHVGELGAHLRVAQAGQLLRPGQRRQLRPQRVRHERLDRAQPGHQDAGRAAGHRAVQRDVRGMGLVECRQQALPGVRRQVGLHEGEGHRQVVVACHLRQPRHLGLHLRVVRGHLEHAVADLAHRVRQPEDLVG